MWICLVQALTLATHAYLTSGKGKGIVLAAPATEPVRTIQANEHYLEHYLVRQKQDLVRNEYEIVRMPRRLCVLEH